MVDVIIVGAGPAGLFAALELSRSSANVLVIDQGKDISDRACPMKNKGHCLHCDPCHIMCGVGGAGAYLDGLLNLHPNIGGDLEHLSGDNAWDLVNEVDSTFLGYGAPNQILEPSEDRCRNAQAKSGRSWRAFCTHKTTSYGFKKQNAEDHCHIQARPGAKRYQVSAKLQSRGSDNRRRQMPWSQTGRWNSNKG